MKKYLSILCLFLTAVIWGFAFVFQVKGTENIGSFTFNATRFVLGTVSLIPVVAVFEGKKIIKKEISLKKILPGWIICGTILCIASSLQQIGVKITGSAGLSGFITSIYTVLTPVMYFLIFRKKTKLSVWIGAFLAVGGLALLCIKPGVGLTFGVGELILLIGAIFWAAHMISVDHFARELPSLSFAWGQFLVCTILSLICAVAFESGDFSAAVLLDAKWDIIYCGVASVGIAYTLQIIGQKNTDPTFAAIVFSLESVFSAVGGVVFGIDSITAVGYVGCAVIFAGIVISQLEPREKSDNKSI